jgi:CSLREA domain-containing protein
MILAHSSRRLADLVAFHPRLESLEDRAVPATFNVTTTLDVVDPADGNRSLREAVNAANANAGADVIILPAGVHKIALAGAGEDANASGDLDVTGGVTIRGTGIGLTFVDGQQLDRVFDVAGTAPSSIRVVLEKLTIRNGNVNGVGGGVRVGNADLVVRDSAVNGNRVAFSGGGISNHNEPGSGDVRLVRTIIARNVAGIEGGGIGLVNSSLTLTATTVDRNVAGDVGGGLVVTGASSVLTVNGSTVRRNVASSSGGGILALSATLTNSAISGNTASIDGGGINAGTVTLTNSTVSGNSASERGGGINANTATLTNSTVSGNSAAIEGGGLFATSATLLNCTVVENIANTGGGLFHVAGGTFSVKNTIVALNLLAFGGIGPEAFGASFTSRGHNLIGDGTASNGFTNGVNGDIVGTAINPIDPKLGPLQNNGGRNKTHALLGGSPAIDRGDNANLPPTDQRGSGFPRKKDGNGDGVARVDIGAFER